MTDYNFDFNKALEQLQAGQGLTGKDGVLTPLIKQLTEAALKAELNEHLLNTDKPNRKNGYSKKRLKPVWASLSLKPQETEKAASNRS